MIRNTSITIDEAAQLAKCSYHTIHRAIKRGDLAAYKPGKTVLILEWVFHDIRPVIPREADQAFHVIPATCSSDSGQEVGA